jgi:hypothetical protein
MRKEKAIKKSQLYGQAFATIVSVNLILLFAWLWHIELIPNYYQKVSCQTCFNI